MTTVNANEVALGIESFGDDDAPLVLLAGGTTMLSWPDALCERLAAGGRRVVRYDLRDSGESTTADPEAPAYTLRDLAADAAALTDALGGGPAHLAGIGVGGMVAQVAALDHPGAFSALTLAGTRAVAPGPPDDDLPDHDQATMRRLFALPMPDWTDREAVADFAAAGAEILGDDPGAARAIAARIWDRTPGTAPPIQMANQLGMVFAKLDCKPRWRERLPGIAVPTLVVHGRRDPFFPVGNGEAIAREIPGARLLVLDDAATAIPDCGGRRGRRGDAHARVADRRSARLLGVPGGILAAGQAPAVPLPGVAATRSTITRASSGPASSCRKWPPPAMVAWGRPRAPGTRVWKGRSPPLVIGSRSEKAVRSGLSHRSSTCHAARLAPAAGSSGLVGTSVGKARAPALYESSGNGAS